MLQNKGTLSEEVFEERNLRTDVIICRAFRPLPTIFQIAQNNFKNYKYIILFLGKSGMDTLSECLKKWDFEYKVKQSLTNLDSKIIKIYKFKKKK